jgi:fermentation-respiration switch protein FrsA (DUF1100 family)
MTPSKLIALPLLVLLVGSASGTGAASSTRSARTEAAVDEPPSLARACGSASGIEAEPFWLQTEDNVRLYAIDAGTGSVAVVLAHQGRSDLCEELPYAKTLVGAGLRVLAFDFRGNGHSAYPSKNALAYRRDFAAAINHLKGDGATRVFLIGASMGGAAAVQNSGGLPFAESSACPARASGPGSASTSRGRGRSARPSSTSVAGAITERRSRRHESSSAPLARATSAAFSTAGHSTDGSSSSPRRLQRRTAP